MFKLTIDTGNAAFGDDITSTLAEIARLLRNTANRIENGSDTGHLMDYNGNTVGSFRLTGKRK